MSVSDAVPNPVALRRDVLLGGGGAAANPQGLPSPLTRND